jgi:uncharacterized membrane protein YfcA
LNTLEFTLVVALGSFLAGMLGSLTGLGGGVVIVPLLTLVFGVDIRYAIGASLVSVIATSSGAAAAYLREGYSNMRVGDRVWARVAVLGLYDYADAGRSVGGDGAGSDRDDAAAGWDLSYL